MTTYLYSHRDCLFHDTGHDHPERSDRLRAVLHQLDAEKFPDLVRRDAPLATRDALALVHTGAYIDYIEKSTPKAGIRSTPSLFINGWQIQDRSLDGIKARIDKELQKLDQK